MQTKLVLKQRSALKLRFQPGASGPAGTITVGTVTTGAPGSDVIVTNVGTDTAAILNFTIPEGDPGIQGETGNKGWSPVEAGVADGARIVKALTGWVGGEGTPPPVTAGGLTQYVGPTGYVTDIAEAVDFRGAAGTATIPDGDKGDITTSDSGDTWVVNAGAVGTTELDDKAATFAKVQDIATARLLGRATAGSGQIEELTAAQATALLSALAGDTGTGGTKGLAPAPAAGDAAAGKYLHADGTWKAPAAAGAVRYDASQSLSSGEQAQARSNIAAIPQPQTGVGVGQRVAIAPPGDNGYNLPAGGTWEWWVMRFAVSGNVYNGVFQSGVHAGGTNIAASTVGSYYLGIARRVL